MSALGELFVIDGGSLPVTRQGQTGRMVGTATIYPEYRTVAYDSEVTTCFVLEVSGELVTVHPDNAVPAEEYDRLAGKCTCGDAMRPGAYDPECPIDGEL